MFQVKTYYRAFLINVEGRNILTDPVFSNRSSPVRFAGPKRYIPPAIPLDKLPKIDVVTVSHNHYDHLDIRALKSLYNLNSDTIFLSVHKVLHGIQINYKKNSEIFSKN